MPYIIAGAFLAGVLVSYFFLARPVRNAMLQHQENLKESKSLLESAMNERDELKQRIADLEYQNKELEKDLSFERSKSS